jgi:hypothetical protein
LEKVQEDAFGGKQVGGGAFDFGDRGTSRHELAIIGERLGVAATTVSSEDHIQQAEAREDHWATGDHAGAGTGGSGEQGRGRISGAERTLGEA